MSDFFSKFDPTDLTMLFVVAGSFVAGIAAIIGGIWYKIRKAEIAAALKQDMLNRGMSAEDIKTVLEAGSKPPAVTIAWKK